VHVQPSYGDGRTEPAPAPGYKRRVDLGCDEVATHS
jgi:hypothetical protein